MALSVNFSISCSVACEVTPTCVMAVSKSIAVSTTPLNIFCIKSEIGSNVRAKL